MADMTAQDTAAVDRRSGERRSTVRLGDRSRKVAVAFRTAAIPAPLASGAALAFEVSGLLIAGFAAAVIAGGAIPAAYGAVLAAMVLTAVFGRMAGVYELALIRRHQIRLGRVIGAWTAAFGFVTVVMLVGDVAPDLPRSFYPVWYAAGTVGLAVVTAFSSVTVRRLTAEGRLQRRAVIVGGGPLAEELITQIERDGGNELRILGIFDDRADERSPESQNGHPKLGTVPDLVDFARVASVDLVIVCLPMTAENRLLQLLKQLWVLPVDIRLAANANKLRLRPRSYSYIGRVPFLDVFDKPISGWDQVVKRVFDVVVASLAIVGLAPVMIGTALAVRLDSRGPVLFRQKRYGFNNEVISVLKFRSMFHDMADPAARKVVTRDDPRVTRVGRFIRRTSLDELPQLFNVLRGELSLVGPRPHAVNAHTEQRLWEEVVDGYFARHKVKPGVTGWAQINGWRGEVDSREKIQGRVEHDLHYIENWSVLFDLYILLLTPIRILNQENAY